MNEAEAIEAYGRWNAEHKHDPVIVDVAIFIAGARWNAEHAESTWVQTVAAAMRAQTDAYMAALDRIVELERLRAEG